MTLSVGSGAAHQRFGINPGPLKTRGEVPKEDPNAGRCEAQLKDRKGRCLNDAKWSVLTTHGEYLLCGVHARTVPMVLAQERIDG